MLEHTTKLPLRFFVLYATLLCLQNGFYSLFCIRSFVHRYERVILVKALVSTRSTHVSSDALEQLRANFVAAHHRWLSLFSAPDCLRIAEKRHAMLMARLRYQDAKMNWLYKLRFD